MITKIVRFLHVQADRFKLHFLKNPNQPSPVNLSSNLIIFIHAPRSVATFNTILYNYISIQVNNVTGKSMIKRRSLKFEWLVATDKILMLAFGLYYMQMSSRG